MSKKINVNPDHYKTGGRERQGEQIIHEVQKRRAAETVKKTKKSKPGS